MKFNGRPVGRYTGHVTMVRREGEELKQLAIKVQQLPVGWQEECERLLPPPSPPVVGKRYVEGEEQPKYNTDDPTYVADYETWQHRTWAKKIYDATIDENVQFETPAEMLENEGAAAFYDAIYAELGESFSRGEIARWLLTINSIDQVGGADVALAEQGLFQEIARLSGVSGVEEVEAGAGDAIHDEVS
jgi:hypothetical protein